MQIVRNMWMHKEGRNGVSAPARLGHFPEARSVLVLRREAMSGPENGFTSPTLCSVTQWSLACAKIVLAVLRHRLESSQVTSERSCQSRESESIRPA